MANNKLWLLFLLAVSVSDAYKILVVFPMAGKSHSILGNGFVRILLNAGHEVTYITPFPWKDPPKNLTQVDCSSEDGAKIQTMMNITALMKNEIELSKAMTILSNAVHSSIEHPNVQKLMNDPNVHFDLAIVEWLFLDTIISFAAAFDVPYIWFSSLDPHWIVLGLIDEATNPAYTADIKSSSVPPFTFYERIKELGSQLFTTVYRKITLYQESDFYERVVGAVLAKKGKTLVPLETIIYNASMIFSNSHYSLGQPIRLPQNMKPIGGYHIDPELKPLPKELKKIMDESKKGVIYFSMGSNLKSKDLSPELKQDLLKIFGSLPYTVLWKFEENWDNLPSNVHILKWAPQSSILAHPNCILFITHGGLLSSTEAVHYGVPIIGIPVFADQFTNVQKAVNKGYALKVTLGLDMADELKSAILAITGNPSYKEKAKALSALYHERPLKPADELVFWAEHVIRTRGAPHLRSPALDVPFYQKCYLDLALLVLGALFAIRAFIRYLIRSVKNRIVGSKKKNE